MTLNRLLNADNECVGYFTDDAAGRAAMQAARAEWDGFYRGFGDVLAGWHCHSVTTPIKPLELEDVEPGDVDRTVYLHWCSESDTGWRSFAYVGMQCQEWSAKGAASIDVRRHEINRYRRPGKSSRSADLGGPEQAAGVLYVLTIKAPK